MISADSDLVTPYSVLRMWISMESALVNFTIDLLLCVVMHFPRPRPTEFQGELSVFLCCSRVPAMVYCLLFIVYCLFLFSFLLFFFSFFFFPANHRTT